MLDEHKITFACDADQCNIWETFPAEDSTQIIATRYECLEVARRAGWSYSHNRKGKERLPKCWCPFHAEERRSFHYRVPKK